MKKIIAALVTICLIITACPLGLFSVQKTKRCSGCSGKGYLLYSANCRFHAANNCGNCGGSGMIHYNVDCPDCNEGQITYSETCKNCDGSGISAELERVEISQLPHVTMFLKNKDTLSVAGGKIALYYTDDKKVIKDMKLSMVTGFDNTVLGPQILTITYDDFQATFGVEIVDVFPDNFQGHEFVFNNNWSCSCKFSKKPDAPQVLNKTATSITLIDYEGLEYSIDGEQWQSDVEFSNLLPDTEYAFYQRVAASGISYVSESSDALIAKTSTGYKISYDSNGGTANIAPQYKTYGISITLSSQTPTRSGYKFRGWALSPEGPVVYKPGNKYTEDSNVTLYARWIQLCDNCSGNGKISTCYQCNGWYSGCAICSGFGHRECAYCEGEGVIIDIESIALSQFPKSITYSERQNTLLVDGGLITLYYTDDSISVKTLKADMISGYDRNKSGVQELTIKYEWYTTTYQTEIKLAQTFVPTAPTLLRKNHNSVTLMAVVGYEYSCDGTNWQASNAFVGLEPETTYTFYQRMAETDRYYIGPASPALTVKTNEQPQYTPGDIDGVEGVTDADAVYLLYHTFLSDIYPVNQDCDFNGDGEVNDKDAVYLLYYTFLPDLYPIN